MKTFQILNNATYCEGEYALYDLDTQMVIMSGDNYHDKMQDKIAGFFEALDYMGIFYKKQSFEITPEYNIELWNKCDFYDGRED